MPDEDKTLSGSLGFGFDNLMTSPAHTPIQLIRNIVLLAIALQF